METEMEKSSSPVSRSNSISTISRSNSSSSSSGISSSSSSKKRRKVWTFFKGLRAKESSWRYRWRFLWSSLKGKRLNMQISLIDDVLFKIVSVLEAIVLGFTLCFFFCCCGHGHF